MKFLYANYYRYKEIHLKAYSLEIIGPARDIITVSLVGLVRTIDVPIAHPHKGHAAVVAALELILLADERRARGFVFSARTVLNTIASLYIVHAERTRISRCSALHVVVETGELVAIKFIRTVATLVDAITKVRWVGALFVGTLVLSWLTVKGRTGLWLIAAIATIVLCITAPVKWNALVSVNALEMRCRTIGSTSPTIVRQDKVCGTHALVVRFLRRQNAQSGTVGS